MQELGTLIRAGITAALLLIAIWWLYVVFGLLGTAPVKSEDGSTLDEFERAKGILTAVLPLPTLALGYWFGAAGKEKAEKAADKAQGKAEESQKRLSLVEGSLDPEVLDNIKNKYPESFSDER